MIQDRTSLYSSLSDRARRCLKKTKQNKKKSVSAGHSDSCLQPLPAPALWEAEVGGSFEPRSSRSSSADTARPLCLLKLKLARHGGTCLQSQLLRRLRQEDCLNLGGGGCSELRLCHCTLAWATEQDSIPSFKKSKKCGISL